MLIKVVHNLLSYYKMGNNQNAGNHTTEMHRMNQQPPELVDHQTELH